MHESEKEITLKYIEKGAVATKVDLFIPVRVAEEFIFDCSSKSVAIIGLDLFEILNNKIKPLIEYVNNSEYLYMYSNWDEIVKVCNDSCLKFIHYIKSNKRDLSFLYVNPVFEFFSDWETDR